MPRRFLLLLASLALLSACAPKAGADGPTGPNPRLATAVLRSGGVEIEVELARSPAERETGLMFRESLAEGKGMLFVFEADERLAFWMKNTTIPLSIAYIAADGTVREIHELVPRSLAPVAAGRSVRYALEVPRGWFERVGIRPGDRFEIPPLR